MASLVNPGQKIRLVGDIYPLPNCEFVYKWTILNGNDIANVDDKGILSISPDAKAGDKITIKTTAVTEDPFIVPKATIVTYLLQ